MSERFAVRKWLAGSIGLASDESSDRWVAFTMNSSLEMGNACVCDAASKSQSSVSKRTPDIHSYTYKTQKPHSDFLFISLCLFSLFDLREFQANS